MDIGHWYKIAVKKAARAPWWALSDPRRHQAHKMLPYRFTDAFVPCFQGSDSTLRDANACQCEPSSPAGLSPNPTRMTIIAAGTHEALHVMRFDP